MIRMCVCTYIQYISYIHTYIYIHTVAKLAGLHTVDDSYVCMYIYTWCITYTHIFIYTYSCSIGGLAHRRWFVCVYVRIYNRCHIYKYVYMYTVAALAGLHTVDDSYVLCKYVQYTLICIHTYSCSVGVLAYRRWFVCVYVHIYNIYHIIY